ncbi:MAG: 2-C-methyl-D-erythritol 4-phosphate cytidylyltransferase [candidate division Zixibacteria bacterium]|nr:2-C-methyl-D-erythritol 4-phosphate cytidylyltransferase [candidate division Zixibacteria bacterium]
MKKTSAIIVAGGSGERFGGKVPKQYQLVAGKPLLTWTIERFEKASTIDEIVIVVAEDFLLYVNNQVVNPFDLKKVVKIVPGGENRTESVYKGLKSLPISTGFAAVHDAVRPLVKPEDINLVVSEAKNHRAAILGRPVTETIKRAQDGMILATVDRENLFIAETPQVFQFDLLIEAYENGIANKRLLTDDAAMVEAYGFKVKVVNSTGPNPKLTTVEDMDFINTMLEKEAGV